MGTTACQPFPEWGSVTVSDNRASEAQGIFRPACPALKDAHTGPLGNMVQSVCPPSLVHMGDWKQSMYLSLKEWESQNMRGAH